MASPAPRPSADHGNAIPDPRWELVLRVADSSAFARAPVLRRFLVYVCEQAIHGRTEIKEQQIGCEVFGRSPGYNAAEDNIVRVRAREVRQRLEKYFQTEGAHEPLIITIPKGHYVPVFEARPAGATEAATSRTTGLVREVRRLAVGRRRLWWLAAAPLGVALGLGIGSHRSSWVPPPPSWDRSVPAYKLLWGHLYDRKQATLIVAADSNFALWQDINRTELHLREYTDRSYLPPQDSPDSRAAWLIAGRQYTSLADINILARILQIHPSFPQFSQVRFARHAEIRDFKTRNVILLGSPRGNPWAELFERQLNFLARYDSLSNKVYFHNVAPKAGEPERFLRNETSGEDFATVSLLRNLGNTGWVLILSGLTSSGTEAAGEAVVRPDLCWGLLRSAGISPEGPILPFEALLKLKAVAGGPADITIVACRKPRS